MENFRLKFYQFERAWGKLASHKRSHVWCDVAKHPQINSCFFSAHHAMKQHIDVLALDINKSNPNLLLMHC
jgi:hypothetical protein